MGLSSRRRYRWADGRIVDYWDEVFTGDPDSPAALDDQSAFIASLGASRSDTMRDVLPPGADLTADLAIIDREELEETEGIIAIPGALELLTTLPRDAWALVTSAQHSLAQLRLQAAGLPWPDTAVTAEDIHAGKPDPGCYRLALQRLGRTADQSRVFEDAPAGIAAGLAAGCRTLAVTAATKRAPAEVPWLEDFTCLEWLGVDAAGNSCLRVR